MAFDYSMAEKVRQERAAKLLAEEEVGCAIHTTAMASTSSNVVCNPPCLSSCVSVYAPRKARHPELGIEPETGGGLRAYSLNPMIGAKYVYRSRLHVFTPYVAILVY